MRNISYRNVAILALCSSFIGWLIPAGIAHGATPEQVQDKIEELKFRLYADQNDGIWEDDGGRSKGNDRRFAGGLTAAATYALLASGDSPSDPRLSKAIEYLKQVEMSSTYAVALRCQVWKLLPQTDEVKELISKDVQFLMKGGSKTADQARPGKSVEFNGYYSYHGPAERGDLSNSQFGVLGMWSCAQSGAEIPVSYWLTVDKAWRDLQAGDGGWPYHTYGNDKPRFTMTCAGIATLYITREYLEEQVEQNGSSGPDSAIEKGLQRISQYYASGDRSMYTPYALYGISRIGAASGYKYFGKVNWYKMGSDWMIDTEKSTKSESGGTGRYISDTAFKLLFLVWGSAPVVANKLNYAATAMGNETDTTWNQRPRDVANFARWLGKQLQRSLNWQIVTWDSPMDDWHDAPIMYLSGNKELAASPSQVEKLKQYIQEGGMLLANADSGSAAFAKSVQGLGYTMFPGYEFKELGKNSPIQAMSNGVRNLILLVPSEDLGKAWQHRPSPTTNALFKLSSDVVMASTDSLSVHYKGQTHIVRRDAEKALDTTPQIRVARLSYGGNWDPEPWGWQRLSAILHNNKQVELIVRPVLLGKHELIYHNAEVPKEGSAFGYLGYHVAHLTGTGTFSLTDAQRAELKKFVEAGGTLIVDAAGGSSEFATAAEAELQAMFPQRVEQLKTPLASNHPAFKLPKGQIEIHYRDYVRKQALRRDNVLHMSGVQVGGRTAVFYSPDDLSLGLVGIGVDGIVGYDPKTAVDLMSCIVQHAAK